jgi:hypothetical protein
MVEAVNGKPRTRPTRWIVVLAVACVVVPNLLALLSRWIPLSNGVGVIMVVWLWGGGALLAAVASVVAIALCPWRVMARAATRIGWAAIVAGLSVVPTNVYNRVHWATHQIDSVAPIVTAEGLVRDATLNLKVASVALVLGLAAVIVGRRRQRARENPVQQ